MTPDRRGYLIVPLQVQPGAWYAALTARLSGGYALVEKYFGPPLIVAVFYRLALYAGVNF